MNSALGAQDARPIQAPASAGPELGGRPWDDTLTEIAHLSVPERIRLAGDIWDTLVSAPPECPLPETQWVELDHRLQVYRERLRAVTSKEDGLQRGHGGVMIANDASSGMTASF
jgi:putative addiction module component (TIGR02574 family)